MNQDGYTLAEALAALLMIGLAVAGLTEGVRVVGRLQTTAGREIASTRATRAADRALVRLLQGRGPFRSEDPHGFSGRRTDFSFGCGGGAACGAMLLSGGREARLKVTRPGEPAAVVTLPGVRDAHFEYDGALGSGEAWPIDDERQVLRGVRIVATDRRGPAPIAAARLWVEQEADCEFDLIVRDCRRRTP